jgi:hypothetical protein
MSEPSSSLQVDGIMMRLIQPTAYFYKININMIIVIYVWPLPVGIRTKA